MSKFDNFLSSLYFEFFYKTNLMRKCIGALADLRIELESIPPTGTKYSKRCVSAPPLWVVWYQLDSTIQSGAWRSKFKNSFRFGQRSTVDKCTAKLVNSRVPEIWMEWLQGKIWKVKIIKKGPKNLAKSLLDFRAANACKSPDYVLSFIC